MALLSGVQTDIAPTQHEAVAAAIRDLGAVSGNTLGAIRKAQWVPEGDHFVTTDFMARRETGASAVLLSIVLGNHGVSISQIVEDKSGKLSASGETLGILGVDLTNEVKM